VSEIGALRATHQQDWPGMRKHLGLLSNSRLSRLKSGLLYLTAEVARLEQQREREAIARRQEAVRS
jgi:hypothetical protein